MPILAKLVRGPHPGVVLNEHYDGDGDIVFEHACKLRCEGVVAEEDWAGKRRLR